MKSSLLAKSFRVDKPMSFPLTDRDPAETGGLKKASAQANVDGHIERLIDLQEQLYAEDSWALLIVLQGVDAACLDAQGCVVNPFKVPTSEELDHDFLWRATKRLPPRGDIGIFNRSYYEELLVVRVHQELLENRSCRAGS